MRPLRRPRRRAWRLAAGFASGCVAGAALLLAGVAATSVDAHPTPEQSVTGVRDVLHSPPLLVEAGSKLELRYEVVCQADSLGAPCPVRGNVLVRDDSTEPYRSIPLHRGVGSTLTAVIDAPAGGSAGLTYYAKVEDGLGGSRTVPEGGAEAPQRVWATSRIVRLDLGRHTFGHARQPDGISVRAPWGHDGRSVGLLRGQEQARIGPSAFDVAPDGSVVVLDQVNRRLVVHPPSGASPFLLPITFGGAEGDVAVSSDGAYHVLDQASEPVVRSYTALGNSLGALRIAGQGVDMLRPGAAGPVLHGYPGDVWYPVRRSGLALTLAAQAAGAHPVYRHPDGTGVVVRADSRAATFALVHGERIHRSWSVTSDTDLGEIQLAEPFGRGLLVVLRVWTESRAEFVALVLSEAGLDRSISLDAVEWAESAALGRFRLDQGVLYQLRSSPTGLEIVTFDVGGPS